MPETGFRVEHAYGNAGEALRKVAVQPPIEDEELQEIIKSDSKIGEFASGIEIETVTPQYSGVEPFSLLTFSADFPRAYATRSVGHLVGKTLRREGYEATVDEEPKFLRFGGQFFSAYAKSGRAA